MKTQTPYSAENPRRDGLHSAISDKTVTIVGLGGAAEIAVDLLKCGVERFRFFDPDTLEAGNLVRHACGAGSIGQNKAAATKRLLEAYVGKPLENCLAFADDIFKNRSDFEAAVAESDLLIVGTDTDSSRTYCNDAAVEAGVKSVFVSMFEKGCGGEITAHRPGSACYECLLEYQNRKEFLETYRKNGGKADCSSARDVKTAPGIGIDQSFLAKTASRVALDLLLEGSTHSLAPIGGNWIIFSVSGIPGILEIPLSSLRFEMPRHSNCGCCG